MIEDLRSTCVQYPFVARHPLSRGIRRFTTDAVDTTTHPRTQQHVQGRIESCSVEGSLRNEKEGLRYGSSCLWNATLALEKQMLHPRPETTILRVS